MVTGIGVDIVQCERMRSFFEDSDKALRFFGSDEYDYALKQNSSGIESLAACFAAKEAFGKALGTGLRGICLTDIQVTHLPSGKPALAVQGTARAAMEKSGAARVHLSLSHEKDMAVAFVLLESE